MPNATYMAQNLTNFTKLTDEQKKVWSRDVWKTARNTSFVMQFTGTDINSPIHRITELTKTERGDQAVVTLVTDMVSDGVTGDNQLWDNEEPLRAFDQVVTIDQLRHANRKEGRMAEQRSVVKFREQSKDKLGYWLGDRLDQMGFLTLSGVDYRMRNNGAFRPGFGHNGTAFTRDNNIAKMGHTLYDLAFSTDVAPPSSARHFRWDNATKSLRPGDVEAVTAADRPGYAMLVEAKARMKEEYIRGVRMGAGGEVYHVFMSPQGLAKLKLDPDFLANIRNAGVRGKSNSLFTGAIETIDGLMIHEYRHVYTTRGATTGTSANAGRPGYKWGPNADVVGQRTIMLGAQGLAIADLGSPYWNEETWDYDNQHGIAVGKIMGLMKPKFFSIYTGDEQDFGVMVIDCAI